MIDVVNALSSASVRVSTWRLQLSPFHASVDHPSPDTPRISPSSDDPSPLQTGIGCAMMIQFPHDTIGDVPGGGVLPAVLAGPPKHTAVPIPSVSVGVT